MTNELVGPQDAKLSTRIKGKDVSLFWVTEDDAIISTSYEEAKDYYLTKNKHPRLEDIRSEEDCEIADLDEECPLYPLEVSVSYEYEVRMAYKGQTVVLYSHHFDDYDDPSLASLELEEYDEGFPESEEEIKEEKNRLTLTLSEIREIILDDCREKDMTLFDKWLPSVIASPEEVSGLVREYVRTVVNGEDK